MSAAATAAGYLYASGRLRGRNSREPGEPEREDNEARRREPRVAVIQQEEPKKAPKILYRTRRWKPNE
jgi:hypothetical protein